MVGNSVGDIVGATVGAAVGEAVGDMVGSEVGTAVGAAVDYVGQEMALEEEEEEEEEEDEEEEEQYIFEEMREIELEAEAGLVKATEGEELPEEAFDEICEEAGVTDKLITEDQPYASYMGSIEEDWDKLKVQTKVLWQIPIEM